MVLEKVYSKTDDKFIKHNLKDSPIWKSCHHETELTEEEKKTMFCYVVKFDGLIPIQLTNKQNPK